MRRAEADERLASWMEAAPIEDIVAVWERQPLFADQSERSSRRSGPGRLSHDPRELALLLRTAGQGALEPVWHELLALELPVLAIAGARDDGYSAAAKRIASTAPNGRAAIVEEAGHAAHLQRPEEVARLIAEFLDGLRLARAVRGIAGWRRSPNAPHLRSGLRDHLPGSRERFERYRGQVLFLDAHPEPGPGRHLQRPAPGPGQRRRQRRVEEVQRRQAAGQRQLLGGRELERAAIPHGSVQGARQERVRARASAPRAAARAPGLKPPAPASFTFTTSHASSSTARRSSRREATDSSAAIGVETRWRTSASSRSVRQGCSTNSRSFSSMRRIACTASSTDHAPLASTRSAGHGPTASRTAATRSGSSGSPTFSLKHA